MSTLTAPAYITLIAAIILMVALLLPVNIALYDADSNTVYKERYDLKRRVVMILFLSLPLAIHVYSINCLQVGKCVTWSWVVAAIITLWILSFLLVAFFY